MKINFREKVRDLEWLGGATDKEIEDEKLILNEELDDIAWQLRQYDGNDHNWYMRAVHAAKHKRATLQLITKITGCDKPKSYFEGELKHKFDVLEAQKISLESKLERKAKKLEKRYRVIVDQRRIINKLKKKIARLSI